MTLPRAPITICIIVTFMFYCFINSLARSSYLYLLSFFSYSFNSTLWSAGTAKSTILQVLSFLLIIIWSSVLAEIRGSVCISKFPEELMHLILQDRFWVVHIPFVRIVKRLFLQEFPVNHFAHQVVSSLILFWCYCYYNHHHYYTDDATVVIGGGVAFEKF